MKRITMVVRGIVGGMTLVSASLGSTSALALTGLDLSDTPLFVSEAAPPLALLVMGRDHKLYYEAYNDASDLDGDGTVDVGYKPQRIDYFGYFDSHKCYTYDGNDGPFVPTGPAGEDKSCDGNWSGDFLNYVTTSRMDALRKVLYGGYRSSDGGDETVLERSFIPQDAHSWGKEYHNIADDGYDISRYTPLSLPAPGRRHLFANTSLGYDQPPLMRVLNDSPFRIWEWVSIERPVAGDRCENGANGPNCANAGTVNDDWSAVPPDLFSDLTQTTYGIGSHNHPYNTDEYDDFEAYYATDANRQGTKSIDRINGTGNPFGADDNYLNIIEGQLIVPEDGTYRLRVRGDDAIDLYIGASGNWTVNRVVASCYGIHGEDYCEGDSDPEVTISLRAGTYPIKLRHEDGYYGDGYRLQWRRSINSTMTDYVVRTRVCDANAGLEENCQGYGEGDVADSYKPTGLLHDFGMDDRMLFGLLSGSYQKNISGGVLRKPVGSFTNEVDPDTGEFRADANGIVDTVDSLRIAGFNYSDYVYGCGWNAAARPINEGECFMWGNPIGEMMYEGLRFLGGAGVPTDAYAINASGNVDAQLGLPLPEWQDPYNDDPDQSDATRAGASYCSKPFELVISDINPSYDTDQLPGSYFNDGNGVSSFDDLTSVAALAGDISDLEDINGDYFIGQAGTNYTGTPSPKAVDDLGRVRGLSPEEPTKRGGYYGASVAYYGHTEDISPATADQRMDTFAVALASPLPRIRIPTQGRTITLVPFAKSVGGSFGITAAKGEFQPTNQIVDFYVDTIRNVEGFPDDADINSGRPYYKFRVNFEDVEQGADHDMDAIVLYEVRVLADGDVDVTLDSIFAAGGIIQHMGYVISGTNSDGTYLEVRDSDTGGSADPDYFLDTPVNAAPDPDGSAWKDGKPLPLSNTRTFSVGDSNGADLLRDPLWYAAKWGGFRDLDDSGTPNQKKEWDSDGDGNPDTYFLVTNAGELGTQLSNAFEAILARTASAASTTFSSGSLQSDTRLYQVRFNSADWSGEVLAYKLSGADAGVEWNAADLLADRGAYDRKIVTYRPAESGTAGGGIAFRWPDGLTLPANPDTDTAWTSSLGDDDLTPSQVLALSRIPGDDSYDDRGDDRLDYVRGAEIDGFRARTSKLGDVVHSAATYVGRPPFLFTKTSYAQFRSDHADRRPMVYVGANDGMLHAFDAGTGEEMYAFVPDSVYDNLPELTDPDYRHRYFVDGTPHYGDVQINGAWRSLLVGGLRGGGRGLYALDVTDPPAPEELEDSIAGRVPLWEFTSDESGFGDENLGYTYGTPSTALFSDGNWYVVAGNGYNSTLGGGDGAAYLFLIRADGSDYQAVKAGDVPTTGSPNGLGPIVPIDLDGDSVTDFIYAGDLRGNLWRFDVRSPSVSADRVFTTEQGQPITVKPTVKRDPSSSDAVLVYFGTGKYIEETDRTVSDDEPTQSFYAIRDEPADTNNSVSRSELLQQTITAEQSASFGEGNEAVVRFTTANPLDDNDRGWYLDLQVEGQPNAGERVISEAILSDTRVKFSSFVPEPDSCKGGGDSWLFVLNSADGSRRDESPFDNDRDGVFDENDKVTNDDGDAVANSGIKQEGGLGATPTTVYDTDGNVEKLYNTDENGELQGAGDGDGGCPAGVTCLNAPGSAYQRQSWREIR